MAFGGSNRGKMLVEPSYGTSEALFYCCAVAPTSLTSFQNNRTKNMLLRAVATALTPLGEAHLFLPIDAPESPGYQGFMRTTSQTPPSSRPLDRPRKEEVTVSLDRQTLDAVDADADLLGLSRSAVLRMAIVKVYPR